jgi:hypothetical protein
MLHMWSSDGNHFPSTTITGRMDNASRKVGVTSVFANQSAHRLGPSVPTPGMRHRFQCNAPAAFDSFDPPVGLVACGDNFLR